MFELERNYTLRFFFLDENVMGVQSGLVFGYSDKNLE